MNIALCMHKMLMHDNKTECWSLMVMIGLELCVYLLRFAPPPPPSSLAALKPSMVCHSGNSLSTLSWNTVKWGCSIQKVVSSCTCQTTQCLPGLYWIITVHTTANCHVICCHCLACEERYALQCKWILLNCGIRSYAWPAERSSGWGRSSVWHCAWDGWSEPGNSGLRPDTCYWSQWHSQLGRWGRSKLDHCWNASHSSLAHKTGQLIYVASI